MVSVLAVPLESQEGKVLEAQSVEADITQGLTLTKGLGL